MDFVSLNILLIYIILIIQSSASLLLLLKINNILKKNSKIENLEKHQEKTKERIDVLEKMLLALAEEISRKAEDNTCQES